jgi:hypothetical protein
MAQDPVTFWDGKFLQFRARAQAITDALAGLGQIFTGPTGYQPGFTMADPSEFPLPATPAPTLTSINPATAEVNTGTHAIVLTGTGFTDADIVTFDGVNQTSVFVNATTINATIPTRATAGTIQVAVKDAFGRVSANRAFTYTAAP